MAWTLYVLLVGTLLALAALSIDGILRRTALPTRWIWLAALAGIVVLSILAPRREPLPLAFKVRVRANVVANVEGLPRRSKSVMGTISATRDAVASSVSNTLARASHGIPKQALLP